MPTNPTTISYSSITIFTQQNPTFMHLKSKILIYSQQSFLSMQVPLVSRTIPSMHTHSGLHRDVAPPQGIGWPKSSHVFGPQCAHSTLISFSLHTSRFTTEIEEMFCYLLIMVGKWDGYDLVLCDYLNWSIGVNMCYNFFFTYPCRWLNVCIE